MQAFLEHRVVVDGFEQSVQCVFRHIVRRTPTVYEPHYHDYLEFLYGIDGEAKVLIGDRWYVMRRGDILAVNAKQVHDVVCEADFADYFVIKFLPDILFRGEQDAEELPYVLLLWQKNLMVSAPPEGNYHADARTEQLIEQIMHEWQQRRFGYGLVIRASLVQLMVHRWRLADPDAERLMSHIPLSLVRPLARALEGAQASYATFGVADAARAANMSYSYFSRVFRRVFGMSFCAYLEDIRLRESLILLLSEDAPIGEIASAVGFHSTSYFIERFRRRYGHSPGAYRRLVSGGAEEQDRRSSDGREGCVRTTHSDVPTDAAYDPERDAEKNTSAGTAERFGSYAQNPSPYENDPCSF